MDHHAQNHPDEFVEKISRIKAAEAQAQKIIEDAKSQAQQTISQARAKVAQIELEGKLEATKAKDRVLRESHAKMARQEEEVLQQARQQAKKVSQLKIPQAKAKKIAEGLLLD
ncbi:hypothetical protein FJZ26_04245 [Candidatus Parvarchaeota archaeon]|nr:hypothetical protein [Candidatus Parvarchaeota archaeon]